MFLPILLIEAGALLIYAGVKGKSVMKLITGDNATPATYPAGQVSSSTVAGSGAPPTPAP